MARTTIIKCDGCDADLSDRDVSTVQIYMHPQLPAGKLPIINDPCKDLDYCYDCLTRFQSCLDAAMQVMRGD